jgi:PBP1b-binding outer membrane lipoprotein LpoB
LNLSFPENERERFSLLSDIKRKMQMKARKRVLIATILALQLAGCRAAAPPVHMQQDVDFSYIKRVAVMPLNNLTGGKFADDIVRQVVINQLLASGLVDVVVPGDVLSAGEKLGIKTLDAADQEQIKSIAAALKVQAVIHGSVIKFGESRSGNVSFPEVTIALMMSEASSGSIIWSVTRTSDQPGFMARHFGASADTMSETVFKVVQQAVQTLSQEL